MSNRTIFKFFLFLIVTSMFFLPLVNSATASSTDPKKDFTGLKSKTTVYPKWFKDTFWDLNDDIAEAVKSGKIGIMIYTSTKSCSYCIAFIERSLNNPAIGKRVQKNFDVLGLEVIADTRITDVNGKTYHVKDFLTKYKAYFTPTLMFFGQDGKLLLSIAGYYPPEKFNIVLDYLEGKHYRDESWRGYFAKHRDTKIKTIARVNDSLFAADPKHLDRRSSKASRPLLVFFDRPNCPECKTMHEQTLSVASTQALMKKFDAVRLNADDKKTSIVLPNGEESNPNAWANKLNIAYFPSFVFFDNSGTEVFRIDTYTRNIRLDGTLELVLEKGYLDEPQLQRWRRQQFVRKISESKK